MSITILNKAKYILYTMSMYALYCALILPHLAYCAEVWGNNYKTNLMFFICYSKGNLCCLLKKFLR